MDATHVLTQPQPYLKRLNWFDWVFALMLITGSGFALAQYGAYMDVYEKGILIGAAAALIQLGWSWKPIRTLLVVAFGVSLFAIWLYGGVADNEGKVFFLKYLISSQSAIMWMSALFFLATGAYWTGTLSRSEFAASVGTGLTWSAVAMGLIGLLVRWYESYLIGADVGHIPISNLYEVFVLFALITALLYLYYEGRYATRQMGAFVLLIIVAAIGFLLWYTFDRQAHEIQPLVPALQSWWMKIHVPANFIGYGAFSLAAMVGTAYLLAQPEGVTPSIRKAFVSVAGATAAIGVILWLFTGLHPLWKWVFWTVTVLASVGAAQGMMASRLPKPEVLDDVSYKAIAIGFAFFTIATILGAMWAAEAWGSYWSWDPKETWALIVWLNYASWLHLRLVKGLRGPVLAWWSVVGLFITAFAFLGVNMFLSGLHSYGEL
ncbi:MAG TPA: c-type cytochrome biogenesis protein CcsB [Burkholderiales bacterium]|nr:c-type cytochrome biogenesis protein CcsB [Burkholderiales bacterium]